jgi:hypothetical protein
MLYKCCLFNDAPYAAVYKNYFLQLENYQKIQMKQSNISISELQGTRIWTFRIRLKSKCLKDNIHTSSLLQFPPDNVNSSPSSYTSYDVLIMRNNLFCKKCAHQCLILNTFPNTTLNMPTPNTTSGGASPKC